jgi:predicted DNA-binding transcriptional regulator AlpA
MSQPEKRYLPGPKVAARYHVTDMSIYRWERDPRLNFPQPIRIGRRKFWDEADLEAWERSRAVSKGEAA